MELLALTITGLGTVALYVAFFHWLIRGDSPRERAAALTPLSDFKTTDSVVLYQNGKFEQKNLDEHGFDQWDLINKIRNEGNHDFSSVKAIILDTRGVVITLHQEQEKKAA